MATTISNLYNINGVLSTDKNVLQNLEELCSAVNAWMTYDTGMAKWAFILNEAGTSAWSFNDSNIIGGIAVTGTGLQDLYNSVRVEFPHIDLNDEKDYIEITIPDVDRNLYEIDNTLLIQFDCINNPVQAEIIGFRQLKQSRVDKIIRFVTDFSSIGIRAGDLIDVTVSAYGYTNKMFRVISVVDSEQDNGNIYLEITALEYNADVYNTDATRYIRSNPNGIISQGAIGIPSMPLVNKIESSSKPRVEISFVVPTGIVEAMEIWYTSDVPPEVNYDENRVYSLLTTAYPDSSNNIFSFGDQLITSTSDLNSGNFLIKVRGINSTTVGPFSPPSGVVYYVPNPATNAITQDTQLVDSNTGRLLTALSLATLLNKVDGLFGNVSGIGSLYDKVFSIFKDDTGTDIKSVAKSGTPTTTLIAGTNNYGAISSPQVNYVIDSLPIAPVVAGTYKFDILFDTNTAGCYGGRGPAHSEVTDKISYQAVLYNGGTIIASGGSGGIGATYWSDFFVTFTASLAAGPTYELELKVTYTAGYNSSLDLDVDVGYNVTRIG